MILNLKNIYTQRHQYFCVIQYISNVLIRGCLHWEIRSNSRK